MSVLGPFEAQDTIREILIEQYIQVAICSMLVFDALITMDKETKYFWTRGYSLTHVFYFVNRYVGIFGAISTLLFQSLEASTRSCLFARWAETIGDVFVGIIIDYILILRVLALWHHDKKLCTSLYSLIICEAGAKLALLIITHKVQRARAFVIASGMVICGSQDTQIERSLVFEFADWVLNAAIGFILLFLALYIAVEHWSSSGLTVFSLINILIKDQIIYYLMVLFCSALNITLTRSKSLATSTSIEGAIFNFIGSTSFLCLIGSRMFLNLKEAAEKHVCEGATHPSQENSMETVTTPHFAVPAGVVSLSGVSAA